MIFAGEVEAERVSRGAAGQRRRSGSADERGRQRLAPGEPGVHLVPELHLGLAKVPAEEHGASVHLARKVAQAETRILELDAELVELALEAGDVARERLDVALEQLGREVFFSGARD